MIDDEIHLTLPRRWSLIRTYPDVSSVNHLITTNLKTQKDLHDEIIIVIVRARSVSDNSFGEGAPSVSATKARTSRRVGLPTAGDLRPRPPAPSKWLRASAERGVPTPYIATSRRPSTARPFDDAAASHGGPSVTRDRKPGTRASSRETVRALFREYHERGNQRARERLIQQYMPLVKSLARRHSNRGEQYEDLVQVGAIGLIKAVDRFDREREVDFGAYAIPNIAGEIKRYLRDRAWPIKVPRRLQELRPCLCACSAELSAQLERPATIAEIAQRSGIEVPEVEAALALERIRSPVSLSRSAAAQETDDRSVDLEGVLDGGFELGEQRAVLAAGFRVLTARERRLLHLRFFAGLSQPQIAREVGISQVHVSRLTRRALEKMRAHIGPVQEAASGQPSGAR